MVYTSDTMLFKGASTEDTESPRRAISLWCELFCKFVHPSRPISVYKGQLRRAVHLAMPSWEAKNLEIHADTWFARDVVVLQFYRRTFLKIALNVELWTPIRIDYHAGATVV